MVGVEGRYALYIPKAYKDGENHDSAAYLKIAGALEGLVKQVLAQNKAFGKLQGGLLSSEKQCLA